MEQKIKIGAIAVIALLVIAGIATAVVLTNTGDDKNNSSKKVDTDFASMTWGDVVAEARGQTVNWYIWDGDVNVNKFIENDVSAEAEKYGVKINLVGVSDPAHIVTKVRTELNNGITKNGSVDMAWLCAAYFKELKENKCLFGNEWAWTLPNTSLVDWSIDSIQNDAGTPVEGYESPWGTSEFQLVVYDPSNTIEKMPTNFIEFMEWAKSNPNKFTYCSPVGGDAFYGLALMKSILYELDNDGSGGYKLYTGTEPGYERYTPDKWANKTQSEFEEATNYLWKYLKDLDAVDYEGSGKYPVRSVINQALTNKQVLFSFTNASAGVTPEVRNGIIPRGSHPIPMTTGLADTNYQLIPLNATSKAGAMVVANILLQPDMQAKWLSQTGNNISISEGKMTPTMLKTYNDNVDRDPDTYLTSEQIAASSAPDVTSSLIPWMQEIWKKKISGS